MCTPPLGGRRAATAVGATRLRSKLATVRWQLRWWPTSSFSGGGEGDCVSASALAAMVLARGECNHDATLVTAALCLGLRTRRRPSPDPTRRPATHHEGGHVSPLAPPRRHRAAQPRQIEPAATTSGAAAPHLPRRRDGQEDGNHAARRQPRQCHRRQVLRKERRTPQALQRPRTQRRGGQRVRPAKQLPVRPRAPRRERLQRAHRLRARERG
jgi:hypothetical protein